MYIPLSALQHYAFCPRQCALIHNEQLWAENHLTAQGRVLHERVDAGMPETRKNIRYERSVHAASERYRITGILDLVETNLTTGQITPIEYKHGKPKQDNSDEIQLCAQALCLEEMTGQTIPEACFWYGKTRHRHTIPLTNELRQATIVAIEKVHSLLESGTTPPPKYGRHCQNCSLYDECQPGLIANDRSKHYIDTLYEESDHA